MAATLADLFAGNGVTFSNSGDIDADNHATEVLRLAQKYDPNAKVGEGGNIQYDKSKLPQASAQLQAMAGKGNFWNNFASLTADGKGGYTGNGGADVNDLSKVIHDPNYGDFVYKGYMGQAEGDSTSGFMGQMEKYMPAVVSAVMAAGIGAGAGPALGGLISAGLKEGDSLSMGGGLNWETLMGALAGMTGIPGASTLTNFIMNEMQRQKQGG